MEEGPRAWRREGRKDEMARARGREEGWCEKGVMVLDVRRAERAVKRARERAGLGNGGEGGWRRERREREVRVEAVRRRGV